MYLQWQSECVQRICASNAKTTKLLVVKLGVLTLTQSCEEKIEKEPHCFELQISIVNVCQIKQSLWLHDKGIKKRGRSLIRQGL